MKLQSIEANGYQKQQNFGMISISNKRISVRTIKALLDNVGCTAPETRAAIRSEIFDLAKRDEVWGSPDTIINITPDSPSILRFTKYRGSGNSKQVERFNFVAINPITGIRIKIRNAYRVLMDTNKTRNKMSESRTQI